MAETANTPNIEGYTTKEGDQAAMVCINHATSSIHAHADELLSSERNNARIRTMRERFKQLNEDAYVWDAETSDIPDDWKTENLAGSSFAYDPMRIEIINVPIVDFDTDIPNKFDNERSSWSYVGDTPDSGYMIFARPQLIELSIPRNEDVTYTVLNDEMREQGMKSVIQIGEYRVFLIPTPLHPDEIEAIFGEAIDPEDAVEICIVRGQPSEEEKKDLLTGHRRREGASISNSVPIATMKQVLEQLQSLGYRVVTSIPSDQRRKRVYMKFGMVQSPNNSCWLLSPIPELLRTLERR